MSLLFGTGRTNEQALRQCQRKLTREAIEARRLAEKYKLDSATLREKARRAQAEGDPALAQTYAAQCVKLKHDSLRLEQQKASLSDRAQSLDDSRRTNETAKTMREATIIHARMNYALSARQMQHVGLRYRYEHQTMAEKQEILDDLNDDIRTDTAMDAEVDLGKEASALLDELDGENQLEVELRAGRASCIALPAPGASAAHSHTDDELESLIRQLQGK